MYRVSFTGYRPSKLPFFGEDDPMCAALKARISDKVEELYRLGATGFFTGMALGVDTWGAEAVLSLQKKHPEVRLYAMIPCRGQENKWSAADKQRYARILQLCSKVLCISPEYTSDCMHKRNRALVDICDFLVAVYDGRSGGTQYTVNYAEKQGKRVIVIPPV
ncbi:MAG: DUF1273 family protein [Oscillospiraceae bacterium]|nr:DUF1273 family protein [Oscillospiraceae bacterium]